MTESEKALALEHLGRMVKEGRYLDCGAHISLPVLHSMGVALDALKERKTGKWITEEIGLMSYATKCSVCGTTLHKGHGFGNAKEYTEYINEFCMLDKFCHECGAKMEVDG